MAIIKKIGVLAHPEREASIAVAHEVARIAEALGLAYWLKEKWKAADIKPEDIQNIDLLVAIGGDGAMLQAARLGAPFDIPIFGLNMGYLGFLTEAQPGDWPACAARILAGDYWIENRIMITGEVWRDEQRIFCEDALNDIVISRGHIPRAIRMDAYINEEWATTYSADALIIATATGSTAYALAAGGPILPPELDNILMVPVAPHLSMERSVILAKGASLKIVVFSRKSTETVVAADGQNPFNLKVGDEVRVKVSKNHASFMRLQNRNYFFRSLMDRMEPRFLPKHPVSRANDGEKSDEEKT